MERISDLIDSGSKVLKLFLGEGKRSTFSGYVGILVQGKVIKLRLLVLSYDALYDSSHYVKYLGKLYIVDCSCKAFRGDLTTEALRCIR